MQATLTRKDLTDVFGADQFRSVPAGPDGNVLIEADTGKGIAPIMVPNYNTVLLMNPPDNAQPLTRDAQVRRGRTLLGKVVGPHGQPVTDAIVIGLLEKTHDEGEVLPGDTFTVRQLSPGRVRPLLFYQKEKNLGTSVDVPAAATGPLTVRLQPCGVVAGRIVDADGQPISDLTLELQHVHVANGRIAMLLAHGGVVAKTNRDGRFRAGGLIPGVRYRIRSPRGPFFSILEVELGQVKELGEARAKTE
jgi:hypothetical protein